MPGGGECRHCPAGDVAVPTGAALLLALMALAASGLCDGVLGTLRLTVPACLLWAGAAVATSALNLPLGPAAPLLNPGGAIVPLCFSAYLATRLPLRRASLARAICGAVAVGVVLCGIPAWNAESGAGVPGLWLAAACAAMAARGCTRHPGEALFAGCAGLALSVALRYAAGALGVLAWPASLGGGGTFDVAALALLGAQALYRLPARRRAMSRAALGAEGGRAEGSAP